MWLVYFNFSAYYVEWWHQKRVKFTKGCYLKLLSFLKYQCNKQIAKLFNFIKKKKKKNLSNTNIKRDLSPPATSDKFGKNKKVDHENQKIRG